MPEALKIALGWDLSLPASGESPFKASLCRERISDSEMSFFGLEFIQFIALSMLNTSAFFWSWDERCCTSSRVKSLPSMRAE